MKMKTKIFKKFLLTLGMAVMSTMAWADITGSGTETDPFVLHNVGDWNAFADENTSNVYWASNVYVKLSDDWDNSTDGIRRTTGTSSHFYKGHFDGNGKTLYLNLGSTTTECLSPFAYVDAAKISRLTVDGTIYTSLPYTGGIIGRVHNSTDGELTELYSCICSASINSNYNGRGYHGGLVGHVEQGTVSFEYCVFNGSMSGWDEGTQSQKTSHCAGFVGLAAKGSELIYNKCTMAYATFRIKSDPSTLHILENGATATLGRNVYYIRVLGDAQGAVLPPTTVTASTISYKYSNGTTNYYVPGGEVIGMDPAVVYTLPIKATVKYYGRTLTKGVEYTVSGETEPTTPGAVGEVELRIAGNNSRNYYGTVSYNISIANISSWSALQSLLTSYAKARYITLKEDYIDKRGEGVLVVNGTVTLDLNGYTIDRFLFDGASSVTDGMVIKVVNVKEGNKVIYANLTLKDSSAAGTGTIKGGKNYGNGGGIYNAGTLNMESGTITKNYCIRTTGSVYGTGGGIYNEGTLNITGGTIMNNEADGGGGGIHAKGTVSIKNLSVTGNNSVSKGGGIRLDNSNSSLIENCTITGNHVTAMNTSDGGGIYSNGSDHVVRNCYIADNNAGMGGGGLYIIKGHITLVDCIIENNTALGKNLNLNCGGGGIYLYEGKCTLDGVTIRGNTSHTAGGVYVKGSQTLELKGKMWIYDNIGNAKMANVYLAGDSDAIKIVGPLDKTASLIGVSRNKEGDVTSGLALNPTYADESNFWSDNYLLYWLIKSSEIRLQPSLKWSDSHTSSTWTSVIYVKNGKQYIDAPLVINNNQVARITNPIVYGTHGFIFVEEGGQLVYSGTPVFISVLRSVTAASGKDEKANGWYTIAPPVDNPGILTNTNLITAVTSPYNFDLLRYDEPTYTWQTYTAHVGAHDFDVLETGRGYLYRNAYNMTIEYLGNTVAGPIEVSVTKNDLGLLSGFNIIGNPYPHNIYKGTGGAAIQNYTDNEEVLATGFYTLTNEGRWALGYDNSTAIRHSQGLLVQAVKRCSVTIRNTTESSAKTDRDESPRSIRFNISNSQYDDETCALFDEVCGLNKISHRNPDVPMVYIRKTDGDYAIATMNDEVTQFNLNFKAMTTGRYTLKVAVDGEFDYLHVFDRLTGRDIDMLTDEEYSFIGTTKDIEDRFTVRLSYSSGSADDEVFAYQNGSDVIVCGEGELQVFDVLGHFVMSKQVSGAETLSLGTSGVYVFRLVGDDVKTQKIVVR